MNNEVLTERERIKKIIDKEIKAKIKQDRIKHISVLERLRDDIYFKIDNPDYASKKNKL